MALQSMLICVPWRHGLSRASHALWLKEVELQGCPRETRRTESCEKRCDQEQRHDVRRRRDVQTSGGHDKYDKSVQQVHVEAVLAHAGQRWVAQHSRDPTGRGGAPDCGSEQPGIRGSVRCAGAARGPSTTECAAHQSANNGASACCSKGSHPVEFSRPTIGSSTIRHATVSTAASASNPTHDSRAQRATHAPAFAPSDAAPSLVVPWSGATSPGAGASATARSASAAVATPSMKSPSCAGGKKYDHAVLCFQRG